MTSCGASSHHEHSSCLLTTSNHHLTDYQQPCPLITIHPSTAGELSQSHFISNWLTNKTSLKMFQLQVGVLSYQGDFTLDIWAAKWAMGACTRCSLAFWGNRDTNFHEGGTRLPQPKASSGQSWTKRTGTEEKGNHWHADILQPKRKSSAKCVQWRREEAWGRVQRQNRQTDTKRPCVNAVALWLKIINTKIICNLSCPPAYKVSTTGCNRLGCLWFWHILVWCASVQGFRLSKRGLAELHSHTKSLSAGLACRREVHYTLSAQPLHFLYSSISSIFSIHLCCTVLCYVSTLIWVTRYTIWNTQPY